MPFIAIGILIMLASYYDWGWFMANPRAKLWAKILGIDRETARKFYFWHGVGFLIIGIVISLALKFQ